MLLRQNDSVGRNRATLATRIERTRTPLWKEAQPARPIHQKSFQLRSNCPKEMALGQQRGVLLKPGVRRVQGENPVHDGWQAAFGVSPARNQPVAHPTVPFPSQGFESALPTLLAKPIGKPITAPIHSPKLWGLFPTTRGLGPPTPKFHSFCPPPVALEWDRRVVAL